MFLRGPQLLGYFGLLGFEAAHFDDRSRRSLGISPDWTFGIPSVL